MYTVMRYSLACCSDELLDIPVSNLGYYIKSSLRVKTISHGKTQTPVLVYHTKRCKSTECIHSSSQLKVSMININVSKCRRSKKGYCNNDEWENYFTWGTFTVFLQQSAKQEAVVMLLAEPVFFHWRDNPRHHAVLGRGAIKTHHIWFKESVSNQQY